MVNKARLIEKIAELVRDKKIDGITDLSDQSSREGMRICIELRKRCQSKCSFKSAVQAYTASGYFWCDHALRWCVNGSLQPKVLNLLEMLKYYLAHQEDVVTRRTKYDLNKAAGTCTYIRRSC